MCKIVTSKTSQKKKKLKSSNKAHDNPFLCQRVDERNHRLRKLVEKCWTLMESYCSCLQCVSTPLLRQSKWNPKPMTATFVCSQKVDLNLAHFSIFFYILDSKGEADTQSKVTHCVNDSHILFVTIFEVCRGALERQRRHNGERPPNAFAHIKLCNDFTLPHFLPNCR